MIAADTPRFFPGLDFVLTFRLSCPTNHFTFPTQKLSIQNTFKAKLVTAIPSKQEAGSHPYMFLSTFLICPESAQSLVSTFYRYDPLNSSSPPKLTSAVATLDQTPISFCLRFLPNWISCNFSCLPPLGSHKTFSKYTLYQWPLCLKRYPLLLG